MTEKRFTVHKTIGMFHCFYVNDNLTDKVVIDQILHKYEADRLCDLLNSLAEDNKMLNRMIDKRDGWNNLAHEQLFKLGKENEQLKQSYKEFEDECQSTFNAMNRKQNDLYRKNFKLKEENEQLKNNIKEAYNNERTMIGQSVLKQLIDKMEHD